MDAKALFSLPRTPISNRRDQRLKLALDLLRDGHAFEEVCSASNSRMVLHSGRKCFLLGGTFDVEIFAQCYPFSFHIEEGEEVEPLMEQAEDALLEELQAVLVPPHGPSVGISTSLTATLVFPNGTDKALVRRSGPVILDPPEHGCPYPIWVQVTDAHYVCGDCGIVKRDYMGVVSYHPASTTEVFWLAVDALWNLCEGRGKLPEVQDLLLRYELLSCAYRDTLRAVCDGETISCPPYGQRDILFELLADEAAGTLPRGATFRAVDDKERFRQIVGGDHDG